jgi:hypothetical protein
MKTTLSILFIIFALQTFSQDSIIVHFAHGSRPRRQFKDEFKTIGGKKGGHVIIQIDQYAYGFYFTGHRIHIFPHRQSKNGIFQKQTLQEWTTITKDKKSTKVVIPVTTEEKESILTFYNQNLKTPSYDYSFFGQRCASSAYNVLKSIDKIAGGSYYFNAFYPGQLRKELLKQSIKNRYRVTTKEGSKKRRWEGD